MDKVFELKCHELGLGRYNAKHVYTIYVVCENESQAIRSVLKPETLTVEVISEHPCVIIN